MRGWLIGLVQWFRLGEDEASSQTIIQEIDEAMTGGQWTQRQLDIVNALTPASASPRLAVYLESQIGSATFSPWAVFRD